MILMGVGYSLLSQTLIINTSTNITSTWDVEITNIRVLSTNGYAEDDENNTGIGNDKISADLSAVFQAPGDSITYQIEVSNLGTIAAAINNVEVNQVGDNQDIIQISETSTTEDSLKYLEPVNGVGTLNVTLTFNENVTTLPTSSNGNFEVKKMANDSTSYRFTIKPNFIQTNESSVTPGGDNEFDENGYNYKVYTNYGSSVGRKDSYIIITDQNNNMYLSLIGRDINGDFVDIGLPLGFAMPISTSLYSNEQKTLYVYNSMLDEGDTSKAIDTIDSSDLSKINELDFYFSDKYFIGGMDKLYPENQTGFYVRDYDLDVSNIPFNFNN